MPAGIMNGAVMVLFLEECARAVRMPGRDGRTSGSARQESGVKSQCLKALSFIRIERNRPARAAARARVAAPVRGVKAETRGHERSEHRNADYRNVAAIAAGWG
jgi:hypothetical protein